MSGFEIVGIGPGEDAYCNCLTEGGSRPVNVKISSGYVSAVTCAKCTWPILDLDWAEVNADSIPMTATLAVEQRPGAWNPEGPGPVPDEQLVVTLTPREPVEEFAALVDRLTAVNPSPAVLDALLAETAGGAP